MKKVLCPICGNVIRFEDGATSVTCPVCHSLIKIKIQKADDTMLYGGYGMPTEQLFSEDEVIIAELDSSAPQFEKTEGASLKQEKSIPPHLGVRKEKVETPVLAHGKETSVTANIIHVNLNEVKDDKADEKKAEKAVEKEQVKEVVKPETAREKKGAGKEIEWINWDNIECESELLEDDELTSPADVAKGKKRLRVPTDYRLSYLPIYSIVGFISAILMFYTPVLSINGVSIGAGIGAKFIGAVLSGGASVWTIGYAVLEVLFFGVSVSYAYFTFKHFGEYDRHTLTVSVIHSVLQAVLACAYLAGSLYYAFTTAPVSSIWTSAFVVFVLQAYSFISNVDKLPKYNESKRVLLSPKSSQKKAYVLLGLSYFCVWLMVIKVALSLAGNVAFSVGGKMGATAEYLDKVSTLSVGIFGALYRLILTDASSVDFVFGVREGFALYSYIDYASSVALVALIVIYARHASKTSAIFLEEIKPKGNENLFLAEEEKEKNLAKFLKKSGTVTFLIYAVVTTLNVASYAVLYRGAGQIYLAIFTMISFALACAVSCYPYAILSREQYMRAYVEYEEMSAEIPPMSKKQNKLLELIPTLLAIVVNVIFVVFVMI